ncbi:MAG: ferritin [Armatimonadota bacterium]
MLSENVQEALNKQINVELYSSYLYLAMSAWFEAENLRGMAHWMRVQAQEENVHAMKIYDHVYARGGRVVLQAIEAPPAEWESPLGAFEAAYKHECGISARINDLVNLAAEEGDHATQNFLQWFVAEQVEEEASADEVVKKLQLLQDAPRGLIMMLDAELGQRQPGAGEEQ